MTSSSSGKQQINDDLSTTSTWLLIAFFLGWGALLLRIVMQGVAAHLALSSFRSGAYSNLAFQTCTGFVWTLAWLTGGFLFGFVFGIPKVIAATTSATNPALNDPAHDPSPKLKVNTNLEDISDWLTKVLVGATLTQIVKIPSAIKRASEFMSSGDPTLPVSFNAAILVYYSALGFLSGYILTRMFFARAFALADQGAPLTPEMAFTLSDVGVALGGAPSATGSNPSLRRAAIASESIPLNDSTSGDQALLAAKGATVTGDASRALKASELAMQKIPDDPSARLAYAWSLRKLGVSLDVILPIVQAAADRVSASTNPTVLSSVYTSLTYLWLYQPAPSGYEGALKALADYDSKHGPTSSGIEINRACAYAQEFEFLSQSKTASNAADQIKSSRDNALEAVRKALAIDPSSASRLKELLWITADPGDDDLAVFQSDPDFTSLLARN